MTPIVLLMLTASDPAASVLEPFRAAWNSNRVDAALAQVSDNATFTWVVDPAKAVPDVAFTGHEAITAFLESHALGFVLDKVEWKVEGDRATSSARIRSDWFRRLGVEEAGATIDARLGRDGKISALTLALTPESSKRIVAATPEANKAVIRRFYEQLNRKNMGVVDELVSSDFQQHASLPGGPGRQGLKDWFAQLRAAFPDFHFTLDDVVAEGDRVAIRMTGRYTHRGEFLGVAPTGKPIVLLKMDFMRMVNGKIAEHWDAADRLGMLQQLGVVPKLPQWQASPGYDGFR